MPLSEVDRDADLARAFDPSERAALAGRPDRSVAGRLALKQALSDLWADLAPGVPADPRDFVLDTLASGAPCLRSAPAGVPVPSVRVSISHSRHLAVGLAAAPVPESPRAHRQGEP
jgi:phosphopantetheinyl transferase (holo-ACP synthase)